MFPHLERFAGDPILGINSLFQSDTRTDKVNLSIGIYLDEEGHVPLLASVHEAERRLLERRAGKPYLPIEGTPAMRAATAKLLFGEDSAALREKRVATVQTVGSSGALKIAAEFLKRWLPDSQAWVSAPTWENHRAILEGSGIPVHTYSYFDASTGGLDFVGMMSVLEKLSARNIVVLHGCCHNPTGVDLSQQQWEQLIALLSRRKLLPLVDLAYQGFARSLDNDAQPIRAIAEAGIPALVASSFSKNMSIYGERAGALSVICEKSSDAELVLGQLQAIIRRNWSNPPMHANHIVTEVLGDPSLYSLWVNEVAQMRNRIQAMRTLLQGELRRLNPALSFDYLTAQSGMFSYTGLTTAQVQRLRDDAGVYLVGSGRICVAALNRNNVSYVAQAITSVL